jgi:hypothetical protein
MIDTRKLSDLLRIDSLATLHAACCARAIGLRLAGRCCGAGVMHDVHRAAATVPRGFCGFAPPSCEIHRMTHRSIKDLGGGGSNL